MPWPIKDRAAEMERERSQQIDRALKEQKAIDDAKQQEKK